MVKKKKGDADNSLKIVTHLLGLFTGFIGPLIMLLVGEDKKVKEHAKSALNWQFSLMIYFFAGFVLIFILIGFIVLPILAILNVIFCIIATVKAGDNILWKYPLAIPFFKLK
jgi:uncharacterized protein